MIRKGFYKIDGHLYVLIDPISPFIFSRLTPEGLLKNLKMEEEDLDEAVYLGNTSPKMIASLVAMEEENEYESCQLGKILIYAEEELKKISDRIFLLWKSKTNEDLRFNLEDAIVQEIASNKLFNTVDLNNKVFIQIIKDHASFLRKTQNYEHVYENSLDLMFNFRKAFGLRFSLQKDSDQKEIALSYFAIYVYRNVQDQIDEFSKIKVEAQPENE